MYPSLCFPDDLEPASFLRTHWQKRPLLMRGALPGFSPPIDAHELAGLACEPQVESRIVREQGPSGRWQVKHGPFDEAVFEALSEQGWTLLVQDVDKHVPEVAALLERFRFIPDWRLDDIMISYAADGGSVGPHVDAYDVFLIQAEGRRRWRIDTRPNPSDACIPDLDLRILRDFQPDQDWILEPGDLLYLPPGVPHWGIAEGPCVTWSVGMRAPSWRELASAWMEAVADDLARAGRYRDPGLKLQDTSTEILPEVFESIRERIESALRTADADQFRARIGALLTEPKEHLELEHRQPPWSEARILDSLRRQGRLWREGASRLLFCRAADADGHDILFANGEVHPLAPGSGDFLALLCRQPGIEADEILPWLSDPKRAALLRRLFNDGHFSVAEDDID
ncbi:MAG: cupin domain-containing protein [Thiohalocapsa sp.]|nr:cupin domain-containing protein [Thiohalocapsa sp.]